MDFFFCPYCVIMIIQTVQVSLTFKHCWYFITRVNFEICLHKTQNILCSLCYGKFPLKKN